MARLLRLIVTISALCAAICANSEVREVPSLVRTRQLNFVKRAAEAHVSSPFPREPKGKQVYLLIEAGAAYVNVTAYGAPGQDPKDFCGVAR